MSWDVSMSLLVSLVFADVVQVVSSDHDSSVHFSRHNKSFDDSSTNVDSTGEWAVLVDIVTEDGLSRSLVAVADIEFVVSDTSLGLLGQETL